MQDSWNLILDILISLAGALLLGLLFERLRIGAIVGYLLAGVVIGPGGFRLVESGDAVRAIAEIGVALLLFTIGLEFSWQRLRRLGRAPIISSAVAIVGVIALSTALAPVFGQSFKLGAALGIVASISSTAVVLRVLKDRNELDAKHGRTALAVLLVQDIAVVPLVIAMTFLASSEANVAVQLTQAIIRTAALVGGVFAFVVFIVPRLLDEKIVARNRELPIIVAITSCIGATWAAHTFGLSPALGAFFAGLMLAESRFADQMRADVFPLRTLFLTVFFVSIGLLADVPWLLANVWIVLLATVLVMVGKTFVTFITLRMLVPGIIEALATALAVCQIGEFSFVLANIASRDGLFPSGLFQLVISTTLLTLLATPFLTAAAPRLARGLAKRLFPAKRLAESERRSRSDRLAGHTVLIGYGEAGQHAGLVLRDAQRETLVLDIDPRLVRQAEDHGFRAQLGDATLADILEHAQLARARNVVVAVPDPNVSRMVISQAKTLAPDVPVIARVRYHVTREELDCIGADVLIDEEVQVGELLGQAAVGEIEAPADAAHSLR